MTEKWTNDDQRYVRNVEFSMVVAAAQDRNSAKAICDHLNALEDRVAELEAVKADNAELEAMFERQWECKRALNDLWRSEKPEERALTLNDATKISEWAVATITALKAQLDEYRQAMVHISQTTTMAAVSAAGGPQNALCHINYTAQAAIDRIEGSK